VQMELSHVWDEEQTPVGKNGAPIMSQTFHRIKIATCNLRSKIKL
jgi:hypothetical protein